MYRISEMAAQLGISRTALLYYEKLGLVRGRRNRSGYRMYSDLDVQRMRLIQQLQAAGLTLGECKTCLDAKMDRQVLVSRLRHLDAEIARKQQSRRLLAALVGEGGLRNWHESLEQMAPDAHRAWLVSQGFSEKEAARLKWLSKDMNEHEEYMSDFEYILHGLDRWGPGSEYETLKALKYVPFSPKALLELGCGNGPATLVLANHTPAMITSVDNDGAALLRLAKRLDDRGLNARVSPLCASLADLPFKTSQFDLIWAEGCAYIMGVPEAMKQWRGLLKENGCLVFSDLVWNTLQPGESAKNFWKKEYPDMTTGTVRAAQAEAAGYRVLASFALGEAAWRAYYVPLKQRVELVVSKMQGSRALFDIKAELDLCLQDNADFNYQFFVLSKKNENMTQSCE
jgi:DNA-binding transcriptional MerR regulator/ubiquinone/menaquinone biosynthesis C-methylase UbiE